MRSAIALLLAGSAALAGEPDALPDVGFTGLSIQRFERQCFGAGSVHFDPKLMRARDDFIEVPDHPAGGWRVVLAGRLAAADPQGYEVRYDGGPSCDPTFSLWKEGAAEPIGEFGGDHLVLPGNGFLYVIRRSNRSFEGREKWQLLDGALSEVVPSHYYVGLDTHTRRALSLLQAPTPGSAAIAALPAGESVRIVVQQVIGSRDWYLVRSRFGLLGWIEDSAYGEDRAFEDLQFFGD